MKGADHDSRHPIQGGFKRQWGRAVQSETSRFRNGTSWRGGTRKGRQHGPQGASNPSPPGYLACVAHQAAHHRWIRLPFGRLESLWLAASAAKRGAGTRGRWAHSGVEGGLQGLPQLGEGFALDGLHLMLALADSGCHLGEGERGIVAVTPVEHAHLGFGETVQMLM